MDDKNNASILNKNKTLYIYFGVILLISIFITGIIGYYFGKNSSSSQKLKVENVISENSIETINTPTPLPTPYAIVVNEVDSTKVDKEKIDDRVCSKYGFAQKWEYLTSYTIKENDSIQGIAKNELGDEARVNEILMLNGTGPLVVGAILYLPPASIKKSSGNLKQINGKLTGRDTGAWHIALTSDNEGQGLLIPAYLFKNISNRDSYNLGECLSIFLDDGNEVYTVTRL